MKKYKASGHNVPSPWLFRKEKAERINRSAFELRDRIFELVYACRNDQLPNESRLSYALYGILITLLSGGGPCSQGQQGLREHHLPRLQRRQVRL